MVKLLISRHHGLVLVDGEANFGVKMINERKAAFTDTSNL